MQRTATNNYRAALARLLALAGLALTLALFLPEHALAQWQPSSSNSNDIHNTNIGNVGIGTGSPADLLTVNTSTNDVGITLRGATTNISPTLKFTDSGGTVRSRIGIAGSAGNLTAGSVANDLVFRAEANNILFATNAGANTLLFLGSGNGNVGIGTTNPPYRLTVDNTVDNSTLANIRIRALSTRYRSDLTVGSTGLGINAYDDTAAAYLPITIDASKTILGMQGNVGIGTTNPTARLHVEGNLHANGAITGTSITATYQDIAEWVATREGALPAGTVVVLDPEHNNRVMSSARAYDTSVAGVISAQPGIILGEAGAGRVMVATTGRVRVRVDATRAPIQVGDLLVTSDMPGVAMRSMPIEVGGAQIHRPGTLIGKALEPLERGTGEILVLLSLQ